MFVSSPIGSVRCRPGAPCCTRRWTSRPELDVAENDGPGGDEGGRVDHGMRSGDGSAMAAGGLPPEPPSYQGRVGSAGLVASRLSGSLAGA